MFSQRVIKEHQSSLQKCNKHCDICTNFLVHSNEFTCFATKCKYKVKSNLKCTTNNIIYLLSCENCGKQYVGSAIKLKI